MLLECLVCDSIFKALSSFFSRKDFRLYLSLSSPLLEEAIFFSKESGSFGKAERANGVYSRNIMTYFWNSLNKEMKKSVSEKETKLLVLCHIKEIILVRNYYLVPFTEISGFLEFLQ